MRTLQDNYHERGFTVLAFPCNQFGAQEPGTNAEIQAFATGKYQANFPSFAKIDVNGDTACPLYQFLTSAAPGDDGSTTIPWNFTKFLVDRSGNVVMRSAPTATPESLRADIEALL